MKLFEKTIEERREAFVKARFAEKNVFDEADMESVVANAGETISLSIIKGALLDILDEEMLSGWVVHLGIYPLSFDDRNNEQCRIKETFLENDAVQFTSLFNYLDGEVSGFDLYWHNVFSITRHWGISSYKRRKTPCFFFCEKNEIRPMSVKDFLLFFEKSGVKEIPIELFSNLSDGIKLEREKAESDFDKAVACDETGTSIVHADWVVVYKSWSDMDEGTQYCFHIFPGDCFFEEKVKISESVDRISLENNKSRLLIEKLFNESKQNNNKPCRLRYYNYSGSTGMKLVKDKIEELLKKPKMNRAGSIINQCIIKKIGIRKRSVLITHVGNCCELDFSKALKVEVV